MDWTYKHFKQERGFQAPPDIVLDAARAYVSESLGWNVTHTADGFSAEGYSFFHRAIANVQVQPASGGTRVGVELLVSRAGGAGFMLFDVGGYYNIQIRKWLDGIQYAIHQKLTGSDAATLTLPPPATNKAAAHIFNGCLMFIVAMFALWLVVTFICALIGLITGTLYLFGRGGTLVVHGLWARIISAAILLVAAWILWRIKGKR